MRLRFYFDSEDSLLEVLFPLDIADFFDSDGLKLRLSVDASPHLELAQPFAVSVSLRSVGICPD